jgi:hypothetical protein
MVARTTNPIELSIAPDIRAALERVLASKEFIRANQLCEFLSYVVTAALEGHSDRLKGYTIGVEALGKSPDFDPQIDPIVRVEAIRLRRALAGYYATSGRNDTLVIDIPRGSYIPTFRRRSLPLGLRKYPLGAQRSVVLHAIRRWRLLAQIALLAAVISLAMDIAMVTLWRGASPIPHAPAPIGDQVQAKQSASIFPLLFVEPFDVTSLSNDAALAVARLGNKLRDALAHFDEIKVTSTRYTERQQSSVTAHRFTRNGYRLAASAEERSDGTLDLSLRLYDEDDGTIVWTRLLDGVRLPNAAITNEKNIVQWLAPTIAQPYGVIYSREVAKGAADNGDPRYSCVVKAFEHYRWRDSTRSESILGSGLTT